MAIHPWCSWLAAASLQPLFLSSCGVLPASVCVPISLFFKGTSHFGLGPTPIKYGLVLTWLHLQRRRCQIKSHSQVLVVRTWAYLLGWHNSTYSNEHAKSQPSAWLSVSQELALSYPCHLPTSRSVTFLGLGHVPYSFSKAKIQLFLSANPLLITLSLHRPIRSPSSEFL